MDFIWDFGCSAGGDVNGVNRVIWKTFNEKLNYQQPSTVPSK